MTTTSPRPQPLRRLESLPGRPIVVTAAAAALALVGVAAWVAGPRGSDAATAGAVRAEAATGRPAATGDLDDPRSTIDIEWVWEVPGGGNAGLPASDDRNIVFTWGHIAITMLDTSGVEQWSVDHHFVRDVAPALLDEIVLVATDHGTLALDRATGERRWLSGDLVQKANTPVVVGGTVVVTSWDGAVVGLDLDTGELRWRTSVPGSTLGPAAAGDGVAVVIWEDGASAGVAALDAATGDVVWQRNLPPGGTGGPAVDLTHDTVVLVTGDGLGTALDVGDGTVRWTVPVGSAGSAEVPPAVHGATVAFTGMGTHRVVVDGASGDELDRREPVQVVIRSGPVVGPGWRAQATDDGRLVLDHSDGDTRVFRMPARISALRVVDDLLVVAGRNAERNHVVAVRPVPDSGAGASGG